VIPIQEYQTGLVLFMATRTRDYVDHDATVRTCGFRQYGPRTLQTLLSGEVTYLRKDRSQFQCALVCAALTLLALRCGIAYFHGNLDFYWGVLAVFAWIALLSWAAYFTEQRITRKNVASLAHLLKRHETLESVGALIDAMEAGGCAAPALVALLPRLRRQDAALLDSRRRSALYRVLRSYNSELILAILKAFEQVGDDEAIPHVKRLTACPIWIADSEQIKAAACGCLRILCATEGAWKSRRLLLRSARAPTAAAKVLLRPTQKPANVPANQLLRAVHKPFAETREEFTTRERQVAP
jgi:hypothetical protein